MCFSRNQAKVFLAFILVDIFLSIPCSRCRSYDVTYYLNSSSNLAGPRASDFAWKFIVLVHCAVQCSMTSKLSHREQLKAEAQGSQIYAKFKWLQHLVERWLPNCCHGNSFTLYRIQAFAILPYFWRSVHSAIVISSATHCCINCFTLSVMLCKYDSPFMPDNGL